MAAPVPVPLYWTGSILPNGGSRPGELAPGRIVSIYGEHLGPEEPCSGSPDPNRFETPNPNRPHQARIETQVFPKQLCGVEVRVGGIPSGLLYVSAKQINFQVPQQIPVEGSTEVQVTYNGRSGPAARVALRRDGAPDTADAMAEKMLAGLQRVQWESPYGEPAAASQSCMSTPVPPGSHGAVHRYAYYCALSSGGVTEEFYYYPTDYRQPRVELLRADFGLENGYPEFSLVVEQALIERLTRRYGPGKTPEDFSEIGAGFRPSPGSYWNDGDLRIFLHRNRKWSPAGVREGVRLIALHRKVLEERELDNQIYRAFGITRALYSPSVGTDLRRDLGELYPAAEDRPETEQERRKAERETRAALLKLMAQAKEGDRNRRAAVLVAADRLATRMGALLVVASIVNGSEHIQEVENSERVRLQLASHGIRYGGIGHYSGELEYDHSLLRRAWKEFPETQWGQRAFLLLQELLCSLPGNSCKGPNCFRAVIEQGEAFLQQYPDTVFRKEVIYHLAVANDTWWSLSQAEPAEEADVDPASAERARQRAIQLYERLLQMDPHSAEARIGSMALPRLKLKLDTGERKFFCGMC